MRNAFKCISVASILKIFDEPNVIFIIDDGVRSFTYKRNEMEDHIPYDRELVNVHLQTYFVRMDNTRYLKCIANKMTS